MTSKQNLEHKKRHRIFRNQLFSHANTFQIVPCHIQPQNQYFLDHCKNKIYSSCERKVQQTTKDNKREKNRHKSERKLLFSSSARNKVNKQKIQTEYCKVKPYISNCYVWPQTLTQPHTISNNQRYYYHIVPTVPIIQAIPATINIVKQFQNIPLKNMRTTQNRTQISKIYQSKQNIIMKPQDLFNFMQKSKKNRYKKMSQMKHISKTFHQRANNATLFELSQNIKPLKQNYLYHI